MILSNAEPVMVSREDAYSSEDIRALDGVKMEQARQDLSAAFKAATSSHAGDPLPIPTPPTT